MSLVVLVSAKGAPGVTTLTVALAALTPGAVAADLDPDGGDLALRYRRPDGAPLDAETGLLSLVAGLRRDQPGHRWLPAAASGADGTVLPEGPTRLEDHLQVTGGGLDLLLGVNGPEQAGGLGPLWSPLARALSEAGRTVFADCGRVGPASPTMPVVHQADAVIVVARPELEELAHLRERLRFLNSAVPGRFAGRAQIGVVLVAPERDRAVAGRTEQLLHSSGVGVPVLGTVALDQRGAEALRGMNRSRLTRSTLIRSVRSLLPSVSLLAGSIPELSGPVEAPRLSRFTGPAQPPAQAPVQPPAQSPARLSNQTSAHTSPRTSVPQTANPAGASPLAPEPEVDLFAEPRGKVTVPPPIAPTPIPATAATISATTAATAANSPADPTVAARQAFSSHAPSAHPGILPSPASTASPASAASPAQPTSAAHQPFSPHQAPSARQTGPVTPTGPATPVHPIGSAHQTLSARQTGPATPTSLSDPVHPAHQTGPATPTGQADQTPPTHQTGLATPTSLTDPARPISPAHQALSAHQNSPATPTSLSGPVPPTHQTGPATPTGQTDPTGLTSPTTPALPAHQADQADQASPSDQSAAAHQVFSGHQAPWAHPSSPADQATPTTATGPAIPTIPTGPTTPTDSATATGPATPATSTTAATPADPISSTTWTTTAPAPTDGAPPSRPQVVELPAAGGRPAPELRPGSRLGARIGSRSERRARARGETPAETTGEQTLPLRRQNSFFGDAPPVDEDPSLLPLTVAPGVYTPAPTEQPEPEQPEPEQPTFDVPEPSPSVRGFAGLTTPPTAATHSPEVQSPAAGKEAPDELRHTRSRRAAFGRDPGALQTSERRRARRHVMPTEENEKSYGSADYGNQAGEGTPAVGTWLQERSASTDTPEQAELKHTHNDALGWGWAKDQGESAQPRATRNVVEPLTPEDELPPLPRRDPKLAETRGFPEPSAERRDNGTGWIPPDVPPSDLPLLPSSLPTSMPTTVAASPVSSGSSPLEAAEPATVSSLPVDRTDILREIRDRARRGTDGSGTWAGHLRAAGTPAESEDKTLTHTTPDTPADGSAEALADTSTGTSENEPTDTSIGTSVEAVSEPPITAEVPDEDDDRDTAVVRLVRDPYEPPERYEGAADSPEPPEGGR